MIDHVVSKSGCPIRLTAERWKHITEEHCELAGLRAEVLETVLQPERILLGGDEELIALVHWNKGNISWSYIENGPATDLSSPPS